MSNILLQHNCFLGITKALFVHWFTPPHRGEVAHRHNIYKLRLIANARFQAIQAPHNWGRHPRTLLQLGKHWKGKNSFLILSLIISLLGLIQLRSGRNGP